MFACLYIPDFAVQAALLPEPAAARKVLKQSPLAILDGPANLPRVVAASHAARRGGIRDGMTKLQVETYGGVLLRKRSIELEQSAQTALAAYAGTFSPRVESTCAGTVILDISGTSKLFGPPPGIAQLMIAGALPVGFDLRIAIASNPDTALHAAHGFPAITTIPAGQEARRLAPLPVNVLPISPSMSDILDGWGIRTFESLASLPTVAVVERLGQQGLHLQKLARGQVDRPLLLIEPHTDLLASFEFDDPVETLESLFFALNRLLQQLCANLVSASLATNKLRLTLDFEIRQIHNGPDEEQHTHHWKLPLPTQDRNMLFGLLRLYLEKATFSAPVRKLTVEVIPVKPRTAQGNLFAPPSPEPEKLELTLERIRGVVGSRDENGIECVGSPALVDTHKPGSFTVQPFSTIRDAAYSSPAFSPRVALRVFRPAIETSVELHEEKPLFVRLWARHRRVLSASGPWCTSGNWWNFSAWRREEWDVALKTPSGLGFYRIFQDQIRQQWFVEGVFD